MDNALHQITVLAASACLGLLVVSLNFENHANSRFAESLEPTLELTQN